MVVEQTKGYIAGRKALMKTILVLNPKIELQLCIKNCAFSECGCCYNPRFYDLYGFSSVNRVVIQCRYRKV